MRRTPARPRSIAALAALLLGLLAAAVVVAPSAQAAASVQVTFTDADGDPVTDGLVVADRADGTTRSSDAGSSPYTLELADGEWELTGIDLSVTEGGGTTPAAVTVDAGIATPSELTVTLETDTAPAPDPSPDPGPAPGPAPGPRPTPEPTTDPTPGPDAPAPDLGDACDDLDAPTFDDVDPAGPFAPMIACLAAYGLVTGDGTGAFRPTADVTRGEAARFVDGFVTAATGRTLPTPDTTPFTDVDADGPLAVHVLRLHAAGIVTGRTPTTYDPAATLTRGEMAGIVHDALAAVGVQLPEPTTTFTDTPTGGVFTARIAALASAGIVDGHADGTYRPSSDITRGALAKFIALGITEADTATPDRFAADDG